MPQLIVLCPATGQGLSTGVDMSPAEFRIAVILPSTVPCPHCHREHTWYKSDAFLERRAVPR